MASQAPAPRALTPAETRQRQLAPLKAGLYVKAQNGLQLRHRRVRRLVRRMQTAMPWLVETDLPAARAWAELEILGATAFADLFTRGLTDKRGEPRRLLSDFRQLRIAQLAYARDLGMTPAARAALQVDAGRLRALDAASRVAALRREDGARDAD